MSRAWRMMIRGVKPQREIQQVFPKGCEVAWQLCVFNQAEPDDEVFPVQKEQAIIRRQPKVAPRGMRQPIPGCGNVIITLLHRGTELQFVAQKSNSCTVDLNRLASGVADLIGQFKHIVRYLPAATRPDKPLRAPGCLPHKFPLARRRCSPLARVAYQLAIHPGYHAIFIADVSFLKRPARSVARRPPCLHQLAAATQNQ